MRTIARFVIASLFAVAYTCTVEARDVAPLANKAIDARRWEVTDIRFRVSEHLAQPLEVDFSAAFEYGSEHYIVISSIRLF